MRYGWIAVALVLGACETPNGTEDATLPLDAAQQDANGCTPDSGQAFGVTCATNCECASTVCFTFGDGTHACTLHCTMDTDCPSGSQGQKCNAMGYCRP